MKQASIFQLKKREDEIEIYHDEIYDDENKPFCHQFLIIPVRSKIIFNEILMEIRKKFNAKNLTVNWKKLRKKYNRNRNLVAENWLCFLCEGMRNKPFKAIINRKPLLYKDNLGIKISSISINSLEDMSDSYWVHTEDNKEKTRRKYETLLRMGIQGCLHYCFNPEYTSYRNVKVKMFYTDGKVFGNVPLDKKRVLDRMEKKLRSYIEIEPGLEITQIKKSKVKTPEVNLEELTDLVLGSTCYLCEKEEEEWRDRIVRPLKEVYKKRERGITGFSRSSYFRAFTISKCSIDKEDNLSFDEWKIEKGREDHPQQHESLFGK